VNWDNNAGTEDQAASQYVTISNTFMPSAVLLNLASGDFFYLQDKATGLTYQSWKITAVTSYTSWTRFAVTSFGTSGIDFNNNTPLYFSIAKTGTVGAQGATGSVIVAGNSGSVQYNNAGSLGGAANVDIDVTDGRLTLSTADANTVAIPSIGNTKIYATNHAGMNVLAYKTATANIEYMVQPSWGRRRIANWLPAGMSSTTVPGIHGIAAATVVGTATGRTWASTNLLTRSS
jgi:hypothetical protein